MIYDYILNNNEYLNKINHLDALIFSRISYIHIEELKDKLPFTINDLNNYLNLIKISSHDKKLVNLLSNSKRFKDIIITRCENIFDKEKIEQFFGITFLLPNKELFISYRGTDKSMVGLMEDLDMSYKVVPSQIDALNYLEKEKGYKNIYIAGHSKGGNLSMYALINTSFVNRLRIKKVYNFDGPGFLTLDEDYSKVKDKIENYYPNCSIVGRLMNNDSKSIIFKTNKTGIEGHNIYNWIIKDNDFVKTNFLKISNDLKENTNNLLEKLDIKKRKQIITSLYSLFNKDTLLKIKDNKILEIKEIISSIPSINNDEKALLLNYIKLLIKICFPNQKQL